MERLMDNMSDVEDERRLVLDKPLEQQNNKSPNSFVYLVTFLSAIGGFLFGYDTGVVSGAMVFIRDQFGLNHWWQELIVSATILSAWIFSMVSGYMTERFGRKPVIIISSIIFTVGALLMAISWTKMILLLGRFTVGAAIGLSSMTIPIYIAEVAPIEIRGKLVTINNCFITGGQFVAAVVAGAFSLNESNGWRFMLGIAAIPAIIQMVCFVFLPESPRFLIRRGRYQESLEALQKFRGPETDINDEFESIKDNCLGFEREHAERGGTSVFEQIMQNTGLRRALMIGSALMMFQQISGINTVMYYSATIIQMSGVHNKSTAVWLSAATAAVNFIFTFVGLGLVERIGRRLLTLLSLGGVVVSLLVLALAFQMTTIDSPDVGWHSDSARETNCYKINTCFDCTRSKSCGFCFIDKSPSLIDININGTCLLVDPNNYDKSDVGLCKNGTVGDTIWAPEWCPSKYSWLTLLGLMLYLFCFAPGMGPMPWTINSEIYPLWARSFCYSTATSVNWFFNLLVSLSFLTLTQGLTKFGTFYLYAGLAFIGWLFFAFCLPETKGRSLEEVGSLFANDTTVLSTTSHKSVQYVHIRGINRSQTLDEQESD